MQGYIEITQDGIGRISRANLRDNVVGLYTNKIETCIIILICSPKGISLIHNTGKIQSADIIDEFRWHENVAYWTIAYNPNSYPEETRKNELANLLLYFWSDLKEVIGRKLLSTVIDNTGFKFQEASNGFLALSIKGAIEVKVEPNNIIKYEHTVLRNNINFVNNYFLDLEEYIPADLQYDGLDFTPMPRLFKTANEVETMVKTPRFQENELHALALHSYYRHTAELAELDTLAHRDLDAEKNSDDSEERRFTM
jgi:hypothetical protein